MPFLSSSDPERKLIIYLRDSNPNEEFVSLLTSLAEIDFIVLKTESLKNLCEIIHPHAVYTMEEGRLVPPNHPRELVKKG